MIPLFGPSSLKDYYLTFVVDGDLIVGMLLCNNVLLLGTCASEVRCVDVTNENN